MCGCATAPETRSAEPTRPAAAGAALDESVRQRKSADSQPPTRLPLNIDSGRDNVVSPTSWSEKTEPGPAIVEHSEADDPLAAENELSLPALVESVLARNQSLEAMIASWRAAAERYPQAVSLEDPMFQGMIGPASFDTPGLSGGYLAGASQKVPWFGKRALRGQLACFEARAASFDVGDARLQLAQAARLAFYEYYLAERQLELNRANLASVQAFREAAISRYEQGQVTQQDVLQADVELAQLDRRQFELARNRKVASARINTLLHRAPDWPLPPSPKHLGRVVVLPEPELLRQTAVANRPDLAAIAARLYAAQTAVDLADKDYYPDVEVMGRYDAFWQETPLRAMVGLNANVPIYRERLRAATREAMFRASQRRAEYEQRIDDINREVQTVYEQLQASKGLVELYDQRTVPAARRNVEAGRAAYIAGKVDFLSLIVAERQLIDILDQQQDVLASYHSLVSDLERVVAGPVPTVSRPEELPLDTHVE